VWCREQRSSVCGRPVAASACREADDYYRRAKRYERLMKANGIHPNGGPSTTPPMAPPPAAKSLSKAAIAKGAAAKKRKIEGNAAVRMKQDEENDEPVKPKLETSSHPSAYSVIKAEPTPRSGMQFPEANFALSSNQTAIMEHAAPQQQQFDNADSIFEEFCIPDMFSQHSFNEVAVKPEQQPRLMRPPPPTTVGHLKQSPDMERRSEAGKRPVESIVIAD
jgi:hypothetical protein